jgi:hypothetical protein
MTPRVGGSVQESKDGKTGTGVMPAGPELDALVAEKVMGIKPRAVRPAGEVGTAPVLVYTDNRYFADGCQPREQLERALEARPRPYSTDIAAAWEVVERLRLTVTPHLDSWRAARCNWGQSGEINAVGMTNSRPWVEAETAPLAICRAALLDIARPEAPRE